MRLSPAAAVPRIAASRVGSWCSRVSTSAGMAQPSAPSRTSQRAMASRPPCWAGAAAQTAAHTAGRTCGCDGERGRVMRRASGPQHHLAQHSFQLRQSTPRQPSLGRVPGHRLPSMLNSPSIAACRSPASPQAGWPRFVSAGLWQQRGLPLMWWSWEHVQGSRSPPTACPAMNT